MKIEQIKDLWTKDVEINKSELDHEALKIPQLHSKYYKILLDLKKELREINISYEILLAFKTEFYLGAVSPKRLNELKLEAFNKKLSKPELPLYINTDKDVIKLSSQIGELKDSIEFVTDIIKTLNTRGFLLKTALDFIKFTNGV
jgi:hypothetical protein